MVARLIVKTGEDVTLLTELWVIETREVYKHLTPGGVKA